MIGTMLGIFNLLEGILWCGFAVAAGVHWRRAPKQGCRLLLATALLLFGVSDFVEMHTQAWWTPWWLGMWKGICVVVLIFCVWSLWGRKRKPCEKK